MTDLVLTMPRLGETMEEGTIAAWLVAPGAAFRRGEAILELETDKTVVEYPALGDGVMGAALVGPGDVVPVGAPIAHVTVANPQDWQDYKCHLIATFAMQPTIKWQKHLFT